METAATENPEETRVTRSSSDSLAAEVQFLRLGLFVLGAAMLMLSLCFGSYLYKQNNLLISQIDHQTRMLNQNLPVHDHTKQRLDMLRQDLLVFAQGHSDLVPILVKYNFVKVPPQPSPLAPSLSP